MNWVRDIDSFYNFIGYVVLSAPSSFPIEDYLPSDEQMDLDKAFIELRKGVQLIDADATDEKRRARLLGLLDDSLQAYRDGDEVRGAHLLQDFEGLIFKRT